MSLFFRPEDAAKALEASQDKMFFGTKIHVLSHEGFGELPCQALYVGCGVKWGKVPEFKENKAALRFVAENFFMCV